MKRCSVIPFFLFYFLLPFTSASQEPKLILPIGHTLGVTAADFSPDGKRILTAALDNTAKVWEIETGRLLANLRGHTDTLVTARYSPNGKKIVTACEDGTAKIWDANSAELLADLTGHTGKVYVAEFSPDGKKILTSAHDAILKIWDAETGKLIADLKGHTQPVYFAFFSQDGKKIISNSDDSTSKIWDAVTGKMLVDLKGHTNEVWFAELSPDGKKAITGSRDSTARIWDAVTGEVLKEIRDHHAEVSIVHFSPDGKRFVTASDDGDVKLWNAHTYSLIANIKGKKEFKIQRESYYPDIARGANFTPDGKKLLTIYRDSATNIWDASNGKHILHIERGSEYVNNPFFSRDGKKLSLGLAYAHVEIYDLEKGTLLADLKGGANYIQGFDISPDGKRILASNLGGSAKLLDAATGILVAGFPADKNSQLGVYARYSPDGKKVVATSDSTVKLYDAATGTLLLNLKGNQERIWSARFSPDGKKIYTISDKTIKIWDAVRGIFLVDLDKKGNRIDNYNISADGKKIVTISFRDTIAKIMDTENGTLIAELKGHKKPVQYSIFSPSGEKIVTASSDGTAKIWDAKTGMMLLNIKELSTGIRYVIFSPDGKRVVISTRDIQTKITTAKIFDAETGNLITELKHPTTSIRWNLFYSPDRKKILGSMENGSICIWDAESGSILSELKGLRPQVFIFENCFSPDGKKIIAGGNDGFVKIWDAETGTTLAELKEHNFMIQSATFSPDGKKIITVAHDHTAKVWDTETGNSLYTFIAVGKDDYLILDKNNHFDGTEAARKLLYFTCGTEIIELEQVKDQLWVPNLAERILNGETINAATLADLNICNLTPVVDTSEQTALQYRFRITPRLGGLSTTIVYVNGIEVKRYATQQLIKQNEGYQLAIDKKELQKFFVAGKENSISVKSLTAKNSISSRSVSISEKGVEKSTAMPNLYAVVVGVSDYKGEDLDLKFAAKDAIDMASALEISAKKLLNTDSREHVFIYKVHTSAGRDKFPEKNSIKQIFAEIGSKAQPNDILLVFFAGHGVVESEKNQFYFLTADASNISVSGALKNVGISTDELAEWIQPQVMKAQKRILIFDACNSGQALKEIISFNNDAKNLFASRGDENGKQKKAIEKLNEKSGMFILSASASDQKAYEIGKYNQGALTYSLLKAIKEQPDILEDRQYLNISRWFSAAEKTVGELARETGTRQQPQVVSTSNYNIGVVDEEVRSKIILPFEKYLFTRSDFRNTALRTDNLKLRALVDKELADLSDENTGATLLFNPEYEGPNVYSLSCDYSVAGNDVTVSGVIIKGGVEIKTKFEVKGKTENLTQLSIAIITAVKEWMENNN